MTISDVSLSIDVREPNPIPYADATPMVAAVKVGCFGHRTSIYCNMTGGTSMSVEAAMMLRAALDVAILHASKP